ncbi:MAG: hypothetical protein D3925_13005 [Candidatus Electrothrix sp. AR5]|nr:hypothetical protein [Candidatus Electrothrix sp. AR5]
MGGENGKLKSCRYCPPTKKALPAFAGRACIVSAPLSPYDEQGAGRSPLPFLSHFLYNGQSNLEIRLLFPFDRTVKFTFLAIATEFLHIRSLGLCSLT